LFPNNYFPKTYFPDTYFPPGAAQGILPTGIPSQEAFGTPKLSDTIHPTGITPADAFGTAKLSDTIHPTGITPADAFGHPSIPTNVTTTPSGIMSAEFFGVPSVFKPSPAPLVVVDNSDLTGTYVPMGPTGKFIKLTMTYGRILKEDFKQTKKIKAKINNMKKEGRKVSLKLKFLKGSVNGEIYNIEE